MTNSENSKATVNVKPGAELKRAREKAGITLQAISEDTLIPVARLEALENDEYDAAGSPTHVTGYARAYAKFIAFDATKLIAEFESALGYEREFVTNEGLLANDGAGASSPIDKVNHTTIRIGLIVVGVGLALAVCVLVFNLIFGRDDQSRVNPESPAPTHEVDPENVAKIERHTPIKSADVKIKSKLESNHQQINTTPVQVASTVAPAASSGSMIKRNQDVQSNRANSVDANVTADRPLISSSGVERPTQNDAANNSLYEPSEGIGAELASQILDKLNIQFADECWLRVVDATGRRLVESTKASGQSIQLEGLGPFDITLGQAQAVTMQLNGSPVTIKARPGRKVLKLIVGS